MNTIDKPEVKTYYILTLNGEYKSHSSVEPEQVLETIWDITLYTKEEWLTTLNDTYGVIVNAEEE
jgi:hypothetical protein|tara:strand:- start:150 stop:344 length:195 start_codon:yes stop_codon:yes gene_type:complete